MSANQKRSGEEALLFVLQHPLRRELLKLLIEGGEARSPKELARHTKRPVPNVSYHVRVLADGGAAVLVAEEPGRGLCRALLSGAARRVYLTGSTWSRCTTAGPDDSIGDLGDCR